MAITRREEAEEARRNADERLSRLSAHEELRWGLAGLIGQSRTLQKILREIERLNRFSNTSVLIQGESGTGKELVARAIHHQSPRAAASFVAVNCVAIPVELAESMLFGHARYIVTMPPLRERRDDIPLLVEHFLRLFATEMGMTSSALEPAALELLLAYSFPGNVRELKNVIERALIESGGSTIQARHIHLLQAVPRRQPVAEAHSETTADDLPLNLRRARGDGGNSRNSGFSTSDRRVSH